MGRSLLPQSNAPLSEALRPELNNATKEIGRLNGLVEEAKASMESAKQDLQVMRAERDDLTVCVPC